MESDRFGGPSRTLGDFAATGRRRGGTMKWLWIFAIGLMLGGGTIDSSASGQTASPASSSQSPEVRSPRAVEIRLLQALRTNPATAPYPFSTEPRGSKILLRGRVGAKIVHDVAIRMAIDLGVPVEDAITIDTGFDASGGRGSFGTVPGPGPSLAGNTGFGGPPSFGNVGIGAGGYGGGGMGGYGGGGMAGYGSVPPVFGFPSAGSYGGSPSLIPPPIFGRYDDPFYGFDPPAVVYPPWWGALNAQRVQSNAGFTGVGNNGAAPGAMGPGGGMQGQAVGSATQPLTLGNPGNMLGQNTNNSAGANSTNTDIGAIPDGTIDMAIDGSGVATLRGGVPSLAERIAIGQRVSQTPGVSQVVNLLTVKPTMTRVVASSDTPPPLPIPADESAASPPPKPMITSAPAPAQAITPNGRGMTATPRSASGESSADASMTDRATRAIADRAALIGSTVRVKVRDGVAQLSGKVPSVYEAMLAYRSVQQTPGVRSVDDRLEFTVPDGSAPNPLIDKARPDDAEPYLEAQIRRQIGDIAHIDRVRIQADSLDIRGTLARVEDRDRFDAILRSMPILRGFQVHSDLPVATP